MTVSMQRCSACGKTHYPDALLCFDCAGTAFHRTEIDTATILSTTDIVHRVGARGSEPIRLALIEMAPGTRALARLIGDASPGQSAAISLNGQKLIAMPNPLRIAVGETEL
jgi:uncharacterized OB-fold protein